MEILEIMAQGNDIEEVKALLLPEKKKPFKNTNNSWLEAEKSLIDLIFTNMLSKDTNAYTANTAETGAIYQPHKQRGNP
jgi:two-component SAPR family response regulator